MYRNVKTQWFHINYVTSWCKGWRFTFRPFLLMALGPYTGWAAKSNYATISERINSKHKVVILKTWRSSARISPKEFPLHFIPLDTLSFSILLLCVLSVTSAKIHPSCAFDPVPQCPACLYMPTGADCPGLCGHETALSHLDMLHFPKARSLSCTVFPLGAFLCTFVFHC